MRYVNASLRRSNVDMAYRIYLTDGLRLLTQTTATAFTGQYQSVRWIDIVDPKPEDSRTMGEIVDKIWQNIEG